jgi:hypothetical protein
MRWFAVVGALAACVACERICGELEGSGRAGGIAGGTGGVGAAAGLATGGTVDPGGSAADDVGGSGGLAPAGTASGTGGEGGATPAPGEAGAGGTGATSGTGGSDVSGGDGGAGQADCIQLQGTGESPIIDFNDLSASNLLGEMALDGGGMLTGDPSSGDYRVEGIVEQLGQGFRFEFASCVDATAFTSVRVGFSLAVSTTPGHRPNVVFVTPDNASQIDMQPGFVIDSPTSNTEPPEDICVPFGSSPGADVSRLERIQFRFPFSTNDTSYGIGVYVHDMTFDSNCD